METVLQVETNVTCDRDETVQLEKIETLELAKECLSNSEPKTVKDKCDQVQLINTENKCVKVQSEIYKKFIKNDRFKCNDRFEKL